MFSSHFTFIELDEEEINTIINKNNDFQPLLNLQPDSTIKYQEYESLLLDYVDKIRDSKPFLYRINNVTNINLLQHTFYKTLDHIFTTEIEFICKMLKDVPPLGLKDNYPKKYCKINITVIKPFYLNTGLASTVLTVLAFGTTYFYKIKK
jgi:hypothetical protein